MRWDCAGPSLSAWLLPLYVKPAVGLSRHVLLITRSTHKHFLSGFLSRTSPPPDNQPPSSSSIFFLFTLSLSVMNLFMNYQTPNWDCVEEKAKSNNVLNSPGPPSEHGETLERRTGVLSVFAYESRTRAGKPLIPSSLPPASLQDLPSLTAQTGHREEPLFGRKNNWSTVVLRHLYQTSILTQHCVQGLQEITPINFIQPKNETSVLQCLFHHHIAMLMLASLTSPPCPAGTRTARRIYGNHFSNQGDCARIRFTPLWPTVLLCHSLKSQWSFLRRTMQQYSASHIKMFNCFSFQPAPTCHGAKRSYLTPEKQLIRQRFRAAAELGNGVMSSFA